MVAFAILFGAFIIATVIKFQGSAIINAINDQTAILQEVDLDEEPTAG